MDYAATTPVDPRVLEAMMPYFKERFGNASSRHHAWGWEAEEATVMAREEVAQLIGAVAREIIFTSGATESNNLALRGVAEFHGIDGGAIVSSPVEHSSVLNAVRALAERDHTIHFLPIDSEGRVLLQGIDEIPNSTLLISVMLANHETGVLQPVEEIGRMCKERGILFHIDATQAVGKIPIAVDRLGADLLSLSGHKIYGPKGVGALYIRSRKPRVRLRALIEGGGQERGFRSGTLNVPGIAGLGAACRLAREQLEMDREQITRQRDELQRRLMSISGVHVHGGNAERVCHILNISAKDLTGEGLLTRLKGVAVSTGSACASGSLEPSHVLTAMGVAPQRARNAIRFSLGRMTTDEEVVASAYEMERAIVEARSAVSRKFADP
ncbi:MAG: cysteine desulfurase [Candidatus Eisenbacteria bacterium]|uniref:cysteine desulfurase n=1 Tax=Eiseniibacteriota bacterium TaxID=2212470 RepID=A0A948WAV5_UNCEI|nr:cysteine desulfurase [Candidatus Eisenbacteria bacterium]